MKMYSYRCWKLESLDFIPYLHNDLVVLPPQPFLRGCKPPVRGLSGADRIPFYLLLFLPREPASPSPLLVDPLQAGQPAGLAVVAAATLQGLVQPEHAFVGF